MDEMIRAIQEIDQSNNDLKQAVDTSNQELASIVTLIGDIESKTKVINDIVFQTRLLSFNASVEAARAGEQGKGFSVVAEEIGSLAQLSGNAAREISEMLASSTKKVETIAHATKTRVETLLESGSKKMETGLKTARDCQDVLKEIAESVSKVSSMVQEITSASTEQARGVAEITQAISQLEHATQQNSAVSRQSATASEDLAGQSAVVHDLVKELVQLVEGGSSNRAA
jgi:methyl-accepting chemotaxis protein